MISARRPDAADMAAYRRARIGDAPTASVHGRYEDLQRDTYSRTIGTGADAFVAAREGLRTWRVHTGAGIEVSPVEATVAEGETVALLTRQVGLWVLMACRVEATNDQPKTYGFTYATLPGHPECGLETFQVDHRDDDAVTFELIAEAQPALTLLRLGRPITRVLQRQASIAYLDAMELWVRSSD